MPPRPRLRPRRTSDVNWNDHDYVVYRERSNLHRRPPPSLSCGNARGCTRARPCSWASTCGRVPLATQRSFSPHPILSPHRRQPLGSHLRLNSIRPVCFHLQLIFHRGVTIESPHKKLHRGAQHQRLVQQAAAARFHKATTGGGEGFFADGSVGMEDVRGLDAALAAAAASSENATDEGSSTEGGDWEQREARGEVRLRLRPLLSLLIYCPVARP